ncbi:MAG: metal-dependent hydrolase [Candidatus Lokiarchaeota archaeon]|nr:metal-dependent hydrolase [Candidatus Lokiarchaeota archaeon]
MKTRRQEIRNIMKLTYLGHAGFKVESDDKIIYLDPWLGGPASPMDVNDVDDADIVLVTHDHQDHGYAEARKICEETGAYFVAINELAIDAKKKGLEKVHTLNIGGSIDIDGVRVTLVQAFHSCGKGAPTGFVVKMPSFSFYHAGDTGVFSSMKLFRELYSPDLAMLPIGSYYTMDEKQAALATELVRPKIAVPMHYDTFPPIKADPDKFKKLVKDRTPDTDVEVIEPGESKEFVF